LRSVEEILGEIDALNDELKALEEGLTLWERQSRDIQNLGKARLTG
jgi:hypothetical protein